jgi:DNA primase
MDQVEEVRSKTDIIQLISQYLTLKKSGRNFKALCPFHSEKVPSFMVSPERQIWKCFGCGAGGDVYQFLMRMEGMEFGEALRTLAKRAGIRLKRYRPSEGERQKQVLYEVNHLASEFYHYFLLNHRAGKKALNYILGRGITKDSIRLFKLGYAPSLWNGLQKFLVNKKGYKIGDLLNAGLVSRFKDQYRDFFRDRLLFTLKDHRGNIVGFSGRTPGKWTEALAEKIGPKYINIPETPAYQKGSLLYGLETTRNQIRQADQAVIVEGELDLISSYQAEVENVVALKGSALTEIQSRLLKRFCENIVLALDADVAGDEAVRRGIEIADLLGFNIKVAVVKGAKDPDELAQKKPEKWQKTVLQAIPIYDFYLQSALEKIGFATAEQKKKLGQELLPIYARITDELVKSHYLRALAKKIKVSEEALYAQLEKVEEEPTPLRVRREEVAKKKAEPSVRTRREILEEYLLSLVFQGGKVDILTKTKTKRLIKTPAYERILKLLKDYFKERKRFKSKRFAEMLPAELLGIFNSFYLIDFGPKVEEEEWWEKELKTILKEIEKEDLREQLRESSEKLGELEKEGKPRKPQETQASGKRIPRIIFKAKRADKGVAWK